MPENDQTDSAYICFFNKPFNMLKPKQITKPKPVK